MKIEVGFMCHSVAVRELSKSVLGLCLGLVSLHVELFKVLVMSLEKLVKNFLVNVKGKGLVAIVTLAFLEFTLAFLVCLPELVHGFLHFRQELVKRIEQPDYIPVLRVAFFEPLEAFDREEDARVGHERVLHSVDKFLFQRTMQGPQLVMAVEPLHLQLEVSEPASDIQVGVGSSANRSNLREVFQRLHHEACWERFWHFEYAQDVVLVLVQVSVNLPRSFFHFAYLDCLDIWLVVSDLEPEVLFSFGAALGSVFSHHLQQPFKEFLDLYLRELIWLSSCAVDVFNLLESLDLLRDHVVTVSFELLIPLCASFDKLLLEVLIEGLLEVVPSLHLRSSMQVLDVAQIFRHLRVVRID